MNNQNIAEMSFGQLMDYRNDLVKKYIGEYSKPYWYFDKLKDIDILMQSKQRSIAFAEDKSLSWQEFLAR